MSETSEKSVAAQLNKFARCVHLTGYSEASSLKLFGYSRKKKKNIKTPHNKKFIMATQVWRSLCGHLLSLIGELPEPLRRPRSWGKSGTVARRKRLKRAEINFYPFCLWSFWRIFTGSLRLLLAFFSSNDAAVSLVVVVKEIIKKTNNIPREFCEWCWKVKWRRHECWQSRRPSREAIRCFAVEGLRMTKAPADCATWKSAPAQAPPSNLWRSLF